MFKTNTLVRWKKCEGHYPCSICEDKDLDVVWYRKEILVIKEALHETWQWGTLYQVEEFLLPVRPVPEARWWKEGEAPTISGPAEIEFNVDDVFATGRFAQVHHAHIYKL